MTQFQTIVMSIAIVILIIVLLIIGILIWRDRYKDILPPVLPGCPSPGWQPKTGASGERLCVPNDPPPPGMRPSCAGGFPYIEGSKKADVCTALACANECNIAWDGITGNPQYTKECRNSGQKCHLAN